VDLRPCAVLMDEVEVVAWVVNSENGSKWADLIRKKEDWTVTWAGALSVSTFLGLSSVYTYVKLHNEPATSGELWVFQRIVWVVMVLLAGACVVAQRMISSAEEGMALLLCTEATQFLWTVSPHRWDRFRALESQRIRRTFIILTPLFSSFALSILISCASALVGDTTGVAFVISVTMEIMLGTMCVIWAVHSVVYRHPDHHQTVHVKVVVAPESKSKQLVLVMGEQIATASYQSDARFRRTDEGGGIEAPPSWEVLVGSFAFPVEHGEEQIIWSRLATAIALLPVCPTGPTAW